MGEKKVVVAKDWWQKPTRKITQQAVRVHGFQHTTVTRSEDLPQLLTVEEAAKLLRSHEKTVRKWIQTKDLQSLKIKGRRFVTPEQIGLFLDSQYRKNG